MEAIKDNDMEMWARACKDIIKLLKLPEDTTFRWWWYYVEGFTPKQAVTDFKKYLTEEGKI